MATARPSALLGKYILIAYRTTHIDRAGETGTLVTRCGEIVAVDDHGWVVAVTEEGDHVRCPASKMYRTPADDSLLGTHGQPVRPGFVAAEELVRDFHSAKRPITLKWLDRPSAIALCRVDNPPNPR
jgi:hypothetical protein